MFHLSPGRSWLLNRYITSITRYRDWKWRLLCCEAESRGYRLKVTPGWMPVVKSPDVRHFEPRFIRCYRVNARLRTHPKHPSFPFDCYKMSVLIKTSNSHKKRTVVIHACSWAVALRVEGPKTSVCPWAAERLARAGWERRLTRGLGYGWPMSSHIQKLSGFGKQYLFF